MSALDTISYYYNANDPRTSDWFLISRPGSLAMLLIFYTYFCVSLGPRYMKNRQPYVLRTALILYNLFQISLSTYLFYGFLVRGWLSKYNWKCEPVDYSDDPSAMQMAGITNVYFVCKLTELLDTVFFVFRKKQRQISVLHIYHHTSMPLLAWIGVRYVAGGHGSFFAMMNSFVHIVMYMYYMLTAIGPRVQKYLWWKKYITILQMIQFFAVGFHSAQTLSGECDYPKGLRLITIAQSIIFFYMFGSFYIKANFKKGNTATDPDSSTKSSTSVKND